jgi:uncharacterized repeat protein (TIGR01451 family)
MSEPQSLSIRRHSRPLRLALGAMLGAFAIVCVQMGLLRVGSVGAQSTLDVCPGCTYEGIQEAIDAADPGDTIRVAQGVYTENLAITKSLTLLGGFDSTGWARDLELYETTIDGNRNGSVISVTNDCSTTIDGFTITGGLAEYGAGIYVQGCSVTVTNNLITDNEASPELIPVQISEPVLAGYYHVSGLADPREASEVELWDWTTMTHLGTDDIYADSHFVVWSSSPLVAGHTVRVVASYGYDDAVVQSTTSAGSSESHAAADESSPLPQAASAGTEMPSAAGGGIYLLHSSAVVADNVVTSNTARDFGGGIHAEDSTATIAGNDVMSNSSGTMFPLSLYDGYGGGIAVLPGTEFTVTGNLLADNRVVRGGGGAYITDSMGILISNEIRGNGTGDLWEAEAFGGGVYVANCSPLIQGNEIISNVLGTEASPIEFGAFGGGVYLVGSSSVISGNVIAGNAVVVGMTYDESAQGGGIFAAHAYDGGASTGYHTQPGSPDSWPIIASNRIEGNRVAGSPWVYKGIGGGVSAWGVSLSLVGNHIVSNTAGHDGGGALMRQYRYPYEGPWVTALISGNVLVGNRLNPEEMFEGGGGVTIVGWIMSTVRNNVIEENQGYLAGGLVISLEGEATERVGVVEGNRIAGNEGEAVGAVYASGSGRMEMSNNTISGNVGKTGEGGIDVGYGSFVLSHNDIVSNSGAMAGGLGARGVEYYTTTVALDANRIVGNHSTGTGGGMLIAPDTAFTLTNNVIADNSAEEFGGGICISDSQGSLINNTIVQNEEGAGEGIYLDGTAEATVLNNIIVSHTYGIYNAGSGTSDVTYNDVWGNSVSDYFGVTPGVGNISSDPMFVDPDNWDYHLFLSSPAVNAGDPDEGLAPAVDIDGETRPFGGRVDMGADEVPFDLRIWKSSEPESTFPGETITYSVHVENEGLQSVSGLVITDRVPVNATFAWALEGGALVGD